MLWRSISITTALARLGERGLSADAIVRTCVGPTLVRRILDDTALFWTGQRNGDLAETSVPSILRPWCALLDAEPALTNSTDLLPVHAAEIARAGFPGAQAAEWIQSGSIAHILNWQIEPYLKVMRMPRDLVLSGGHAATRWVTDRLVYTFLEDWRLESLTWELAYARDPEGIAAAAGVSLGVLSERVTTDEMVVKAIHQKLTTTRPSEEVEQGLDANAAITSLGLMLEKNLVDGARAMARRLHQAHPRNNYFALAYAFCTIPANTADAHAVLRDLDIADEPTLSTVRVIDLATCELFEGSTAKAHELLKTVEDQPFTGRVWLWDPLDASAGRATLHYSSFEEWTRCFLLVSGS